MPPSASAPAFITDAIFELPSNLILYRVGARRWLCRILVSWGLVAAVCR